jgi:N-acetylglutamate synthase-like GNAT family acetyltransferase
VLAKKANCMTQIRKVTQRDIPALKEVLETLELFPAEMLDDMISDYLINPESQDIWFTAVEKDKPISIGYAAPEQLTDGTYNLLALGVHSDIQSKGTGKQMVSYIENELREKGQRILIVETSSADAFASSRKFYEDLAYTKEAVIRDFWEEGDDKVVYWKKLK